MDAEKDTTENPETQPAQAEAPAIAADTAEPPDGPDGMDAACKREISIEIPADVVSKEQTTVVQKYSKQASLPGFRKGKVPPGVVRNRFSKEIHNEVMETLVPQYFREAVVKSGLRPVAQPLIYALEAEPGQAIRFKAAFEVVPEFELGAYQDIKVEKLNVKITDEEIEAELKQIQERQASFDPINEERGVKDGEFAQVGFQAIPKETAADTKPQAKPAGEEKPGQAATAAAQPVQMDEVLVEIGGANTIPEFSENLRDAKPKVNAIKKKTLPELNDDFAKELSKDFQTLDQLKQRIRENMETEQKHQAEHTAKEQLVEKLLEKQDFSVPRAMVEHQVDLRLERGLRALAAQGMRTEDMRRMDFRRLRAGQREAAVKEVKSGLLLEKIAEAEKIQVSDEELGQEIAALAGQTHQTPEEVRNRLTQEGALERVRSRMRSEKALNFLYSKPE